MTGPRVILDEPQPPPTGPSLGPSLGPLPLGPTAPAAEAPPATVPPPRPAPRIDFGWEQAVVPLAPARGGAWPAAGLVAAGIGVLAGGLSVLAVAGFVVAQFAANPWLGWLTLSVAVAGFGLVAAGLARELRGLFAIRAVDRARAALRGGDLAAARAAALEWAARVPAAAPSLPALRAAPDLASLRALLRGGPASALEAQAGLLGRDAAVQSFALAALSPSPALDALLVGWRGVRLVRQVAALHGMRPGLLGTLALLRRTALDAAAVAATDMAADVVGHAVLRHPLVVKLGGAAATGAVAARRMVLLARAAAAACQVVEPSRG